MTNIWLECKNCHKGRWVRVAKTKLPTFTNLCFRCHIMSNKPPRKLPSGQPKRKPKYNPKASRKYYLNHKNTPEYRERMKAHEKIKWRVEKGRITPQPCLICGNTKTVGHHPDYNNPLYIVWLCQRCHIGVHRGNLKLPENIQVISLE